MAKIVNGKRVENRGPMYTSGTVANAVVNAANGNTEVAREAQRMAMVNSYTGNAPSWAGQYSTLNDTRQRAAMDVDYQISLIGAAEKNLVAGGAGYYQDGVYTTKTAADKAHAASAEANKNKAYTDTSPTTGNMMGEYSGSTPAAVKVKDGSGADAGPLRKKKRTLLGGYFGADTVLGG